MTPARVALRRGLVAFGVVALAGQLVPTVIDLFGGGLAFPTALKLGWFYTLAFHRVGLEVTTASASRLSIAFLTGTGLVLWLLYRGGRAAGLLAGPSSRERILAGAMIAPAYAVPVGLLTLIVHLQLRTPGGLLSGGVRVDGVTWQAFVFPAAIAVVTGGAGALLASEPQGSRLRAWLVGGWRMMLVALGLALIGLLVVAAVRPQGLRTYARAVAANGPRAAMLVLGHQALLLPNHAFMVLAPSMGACVSLEGAAATIPVLCPGRLPVLGEGLSATLRAASRRAAVPPRRTMPAAYFLLIAVPALATITGGRWAARHADGRERLVRGAGAGIVFGVVVGFGAWATCIAFRSFSFGPVPVPTAMLGLVWGTVGGTLGAVWPAAQEEPGTPEPALPPSPTSV